MFSQLFITGRVWVECLWVDFLWLLHLGAHCLDLRAWSPLSYVSVSAIVVTTTLPWGMCTPQGKDIPYSRRCLSDVLTFHSSTYRWELLHFYETHNGLLVDMYHQL